MALLWLTPWSLIIPFLHGCDMSCWSTGVQFFVFKQNDEAISYNSPCKYAQKCHKQDSQTVQVQLWTAVDCKISSHQMLGFRLSVVGGHLRDLAQAKVQLEQPEEPLARLLGVLCFMSGR